MKVLIFIGGLVGILIGAIFIAHGTEGQSFTTIFLVKLTGLIILACSVFFTRKLLKWN